MSGAAQFNPAVFRHDPAALYPWQVFRRVTIGMVVWNRREMTERAIQALYRNAGMPFDLVILDNGSSDGAAEMLAALAEAQPNVALHRNPENVGKLRGIRQMRDLLPDEGLVVYLDNDIEWLSSLVLVHVQKAFHAVRLATGRPDAVFGLRLINCEEHGFRHASDVLRLTVPGDASGAPRTSYALHNKDHAPAGELHAEQVLIGRSDFILGGCWACPAPLLRGVPFEALYPVFIGGDDSLASSHWSKLGVPMGYIENGPIARHLDWPYSEDKIRLYSELTRKRAVTDLSYLRWKLKRLFG